MYLPPRRWRAPTRLALFLLALQASILGVSWAETLFQAPLFKVGSGPTSIATGDFNGDGRIDLAVANSAANDVSILLGTSDGSFLPQVRIGAGSTPSSVAVADLNGDGLQDVVVANAGSDDVSVFLGRGNQSFGPQSRLPAGDDPSSVVLGDVNRDGFLDIVVANRGSDDISTLAGNGDGTFRGQVRANVGRRPLRVVLADISGDGALDLAVENGGDLSPYAYGDVTVFFNVGDGSFFFLGRFSYSSDFTFTLGDFNRDGLLDMALVDRGGLVRIYEGHGSNGFSFAKDQGGIGYYSAAVAAADLDLDGNIDLVSVSRDSNAAWVALGNGDFTFRLVTSTRDGGSYPRDVVIADFDGDARADLAIANQYSDDISLLRGNGDGSFSLQPHLVTAGPPIRMASGDLNSDGSPDLAVSTAASGLVLYVGDGQGGFADLAPLPAGARPGPLAVGDFNADGMTDLVVLDGETPDVFVLLAEGDGSFASAKRTTVGFSPTDLAAGDFNGDGRPDLAVVTGCSPDNSCDKGAVVVFLGTGDGTFGTPAYYTVGLGPYALAVGDFDGDGIRDLAALNAAGFQIVSELHGYGDGTFAPQRQILLAYYGNGVSATGMAVADWQGDGRDDIVLPVLDNYQDHAILLNGTPYGLSISAYTLPTGEFPSDIASGDFNADGRTDFVTANLFSDDIVVALGNPNDPYGPALAQSYPAVDCASTVVAADFNMDGRADLAVGSFCTPEIAVMLNVGPFPDADRDGLRDSEDACTDPDGDGYGSPGFPANTCPVDNCPKVSNPAQTDGDRDGVGDSCDNCPGTINPGQEDGDKDGAGDACDTCTDIDHDGFGSPGYGFNTCPLDNCPFQPNPSQADADGDGVGDVCDGCTDLDHDGFGNSGFPANTCRTDNCPTVSNPLQEDTDFDGRGDACDPCPLDARNDQDRDGFCADRDNCPKMANPGQEDADGDGLGDQCDNCPNAPNPDQNDSNVDGAGDACQPTVVVSSIDQDGGPVLEVSAHAQDPDGESLSGTLDFFEVTDVTLRNPGIDGLACTIGFSLPEWRPGQGIAYLNVPEIGVAFLYDLDLLSSLAGLPACEDGQEDFSFWQGPCVVAKYAFGPVMYAARGDFCIRSTGAHSGGHDFTIHQISSSSLDGTIVSGVPSLHLPFTGGLPRRSDISSLKPGRKYSLAITVSDELTPPASAREQFLYQGESMMVINTNPHASITAPSQVECDREGGAQVVLDGSSSTDPDSTANSNDDIVSFEWVMNPGQPSEQLLGIGEMLTAMLPLGADHIGLRVTDSQGARDMAQAVMEVRDTTPPSLVCPPAGAVECTSPEGAHVNLVTQVNDLCGPVTIINSRTAGPDASGAYPLGATQITFTATDAVGNVSTCGATVTVRDTTPPSFAMTTDSHVLWPPNHRMVPVHVGWQVSDRCDRSPGVSLVSVVSSESDDAPGNGDGNTTDDIADAAVGTPDSAVLLRAERSGDGSGRAYTLTYATTDASRNTASALGVVTVPHDLGTGPEPLLMNLELGGTPGMTHAYWNAVPGAEMYDLIKGDLGQVRAQNGKVWLGPVHVLAAWMTGTSYTEASPREIPATGKAFFYLVQYRNTPNASGWGTESSSWPEEPSSCDIGCP